MLTPRQNLYLDIFLKGQLSNSLVAIIKLETLLSEFIESSEFLWLLL